MHGHDSFTFIGLIPVLGHYPYHIVAAGIVALLLVVMGMMATKALKAKTDPTIPSSKLTYQNFFEIIAEKIYGLCENVMGELAAAQYFPIIATLFIFIFTANVMGLLPGFLPPTDNLNVTLAAGVFVFLFFTIKGFQEHGMGYVKHFFGPIWWLAPLMFVIEIISNLIRPISLGLRLRGNMFGDHTVLSIWLDLMPYYGVPVIFYALGLFVCFIQAFVFSLLTMVYINLATAHDH